MNKIIIQQTVVKGKEGIGFFGALFLVFLVLKLTAVITWSWWWVTAPLWGPFALLIGGLALFSLVCLGGIAVIGLIMLIAKFFKR